VTIFWKVRSRRARERRETREVIGEPAPGRSTSGQDLGDQDFRIHGLT
jgi:hypothetical protein